MERVVVDANVFLSTLVHRNDEQRDAAKALLLKAEDGELEVILPQFVIFEIVYVLQSTYRVPATELAPMLRDLMALPGVLVIHECPWKRVLDYWPAPLSSLADASIVAVAASNRYDAIATFDQKLAKRSKDLGVPTYW
ncbi:MAG TPA: PIN domain-containing protein [Thermoanaerobaculia bacterium]|nr:PIN domain-containing protein [Thermoanaerobaculia bacterium]